MVVRIYVSVWRKGNAHPYGDKIKMSLRIPLVGMKQSFTNRLYGSIKITGKDCRAFPSEKLAMAGSRRLLATYR